MPKCPYHGKEECREGDVVELFVVLLRYAMFITNSQNSVKAP